jgi:hypothetical protein
VWVFFAVAKRIYRDRPDDSSFLGKLLSSKARPLPARVQPGENESRAEAP